jgi:tRNA (guanine-N7-)-methyltransferase
MSRKNKLKKFADVLSFPNVYECYDIQQPQLVGIGLQPIDLKSRWNEVHFKNNNPITLELACGAGEYAVGLAEKFPDRNFIGVDIKGNRLWVGAKQALDAGLYNVAFLRTRIEILDVFFAANEIDEIWITFCDPFPRESKYTRRLTSHNFHDIYRRVLRPGGLVHLKHDDPDFYKFTLDTIAEDPACVLLYENFDIYAAPLAYPELEMKTRYEEMHLAKGRKIKYVQYKISTP